jgi:hypothetical protein
LPTSWSILFGAGVERIYGLVGDSLNPLVEAVCRTEGVEWVHVRNSDQLPVSPRTLIDDNIGFQPLR